MIVGTMWSVLCLFVIACVQGTLGKILTDQEEALFPRLYHLDDYERCLAAGGGGRGLYCMGTFHLTPAKPNHLLYTMMEESSKDPMNFNRTLVHRGYCVSRRCTKLSRSGNLNETERFTKCISQWARKLYFEATPISIDFCETSVQANASTELDTPKIVFLTVMFCLLFCNVIGTAYDVITPDLKKNQLLVCWSWKDNWRRLTTVDDSDPERASLLPAHGMKAMLMLLIICVHCGLIYFRLYSYNPLYLEKMLRDPILDLVRGGTPLMCVFLLVGSFMVARGLLLLPHTARPSMLRCLLHRLARIYPAYMVVLWWAALWWGARGAGGARVRAEAASCRHQLWTHALALNNLLYTQPHCLVQTWFLAVDLQLYVVSCALTLTLAAARRRSLVILAALFIASCLLNGVLAYVFEWKSMLFIINPENLRTMFRDVPSFSNLYMSPWSNLPVSLLGVLLAYLHTHLQDINFKFVDHKVLIWLHNLTIPLGVCVMWNGARLHSAGALGPVAVALYSAIERPLLCTLAAFCLLGCCNRHACLSQHLFSWRPWVLISRLSLPALLLHWTVASTALAQPVAQPAFYHTILWDGAATVTVTYLMALPLSLLVEQPLQRTITMLLQPRTNECQPQNQGIEKSVGK